MKIYDNIYLAQRFAEECGREVLSAEGVWCHVALQEREVRAVEKLGRLNLIQSNTHLSLQVACLKVSNNILKALLKARVRLQPFPK